MSIVAAFQPALPSSDPGRLRAALAAVGRRLATSPLDNTVLRAVGTPATTLPSSRPTRLRASWHSVTGSDGAARLEASWHPGH
ncbi:hypothetical protein [Streptomyces sp. CBMA123]|uniref:hypothetical protein n=1 Tax=Streptomyces sp. CBMA123 TaxID=1896313 RepID=UPI001661E85D|nr:hypothetical protein [Streptomyces sp. CBMA123]MBD0690036.1 hypothetical protein [Streptomyces sp. CBMA123]